MKNSLIPVVLALFAAAAGGAGEPEAQVRLPLADYLDLVKQVETVEEARRSAEERQEPVVAEVVAQRRRVLIDDDGVEIWQRFEIDFRGQPLQSVHIPISGTPWQASGDGVALADAPGGIVAAAEEEGRYVVTVDATASFDEHFGVRQIRLASETAPVAITEVELAADLAWSCPGSVVAEDEVDGERRHLRLATTRGQPHTLEIKRSVQGGEAERTLAQAEVMTILAADSAGVTRHDVVLYEVVRGGLHGFSLDLPSTLSAVRLATDEGEQPLLVTGDHLSVNRLNRLTNDGWLVISSPVADPRKIDLATARPSVPIRARYLVLLESVPVEIGIEPSDAWTRIDAADLGDLVGDAVAALTPGAVWRRTADDGGLSTLRLTAIAEADPIPAVIRNRDTLSVVTVEGTLVHRDVFTLVTSGSTLAIDVPTGSTLWSATVDNVAVRPLVRDGQTVVPVPFRSADTVDVEVVIVAERAVPEGRATMDLTLPGVTFPVLQHEWRILLPEESRYRYREGDLFPTASSSRCVTRSRTGSRPSGTSAGRAFGPGGSGAIVGDVLDSGGLALPGVTVSATSDRLTRGPIMAISGVDGNFVFHSLPSDQYRVEANLPGFQPTAADVRVSADRVSRVTFNMIDEAFSGEIEIVAEVPLVDTSRTSSGTTFDTDRLGAGTSGGGSGGFSFRRYPKKTKEQAHQIVDDFGDLQTGLVGGVRPVPVAIPETGKMLRLEGFLPPPTVSVVLDVK